MKSNWPTTSRHERGYGAQWDKTRARILERDNHLCQCRHCKAEGRTRLATEVDHIVDRATAATLCWPTSRIEADENLQAINPECHKRKTIEDQGRTYKPKVKIGLDGFPLRSR